MANNKNERLFYKISNIILLFISIPLTILGIKPSFLRIANKNIEKWEGRVLLFIYLFMIIVFLPLIIFKGCQDEVNIEERGVKIQATVIDVKGVNNLTIRYTYTFKDINYEKITDVPSEFKKAIGEKFYILCDSLNPNNVMPIDYLKN